MSADAPYLEVLEGDMQGTQFRLLGETIMVGRGADCHINLDGARGVSRKHARFILLDGRIRVQDLGSQNGTLVEGKRIKDAVIGDGSTLKIGEVRMRLTVPSSVPASSAPSQPARKSNRRVASAAAGAMSPPAAASPARAVGGDVLEGLPGNEGSRSLLLMLLLIVVGAAGVLYAASVLLSVERRFRPQQALLNKGDIRVIPVSTPFATLEIKGLTQEGGAIASAKQYEGWLRAELESINQKNRPRGFPALWFVITRAQARGDAILYLKNKAGVPFRSIEIVVRGVSDDEWEEPPEPAVARDEADRLLRDAQQFESDNNLYEAIQLYEEAGHLIGTVLREEKRAFDIEDRARGLRVQLKDDLERLFREAMLSAFPPENAPGRRNLQTAFDSLATAKRLLNEDESNLEWQVLDYWQAEIRRLARSRRQ